ncbi:MAG: hypothetical protein ACR2MG_04105 [Pyrinomonadaceae bacterium]
MTGEKTKNQISNQQKIKEELEKIYAEHPEARSGLVEFQLWMKLLHKKQRIEKSGGKSQPEFLPDEIIH